MIELVSVIVPNYNHGNYLKQRIDSILNQTHRNLELIILDDCSSDNSKQIIESYKDARISSVLLNTENSGSVFKQWQKGISLATGDFIWIAESDDWAEPDFLKELIQVFKKDKDLLLVYSDTYIVNSTGERGPKLYSDIRNEVAGDLWVEDYIKAGSQQLRESLSFWCSINNASAVLFKSSALKANLVRLKDYRFAGDWATYVAIALKGKIGYKHTPLSNYRDHSNNTSKNATYKGRIFLDHYRVADLYWRSLKPGERSAFIAKKASSVFEVRSFVSKGQFLKLMIEMFTINPRLIIASAFYIFFAKVKRVFR